MPGVGAPPLVVQRVAALEDHPVDAARAAEHLAAGVVDPPPVHVRLGLGLVLPVVEATADRERQRGRHVDEDVPQVVGAAGLQDEHPVRRVGATGGWPRALPAEPPPTITKSYLVRRHGAVVCPNRPLPARPSLLTSQPLPCAHGARGPTIRRSRLSGRGVARVDGSEVTVACRNVWKVYGPKADSIVGSPEAVAASCRAPREDRVRRGGPRHLLRGGARRGLRGHGAVGERQVDAGPDASHG